MEDNNYLKINKQQYEYYSQVIYLNILLKRNIVKKLIGTALFGKGY